MSACIRKVPVKSNDLIDERHPYRAFREEYLLDIPILFYDENSLVSCNKNVDCVICSYKSPYLLGDAYHFYRTEMERLGWQAITCCADRPGIVQSCCCTLVYEKPFKICVVMLQVDEQEHKKLCIKIVSGPKKVSKKDF
ncbi:MAG: hypothetical protein WA432_03315 [Candidatus Babeliaceae bacterium]